MQIEVDMFELAVIGALYLIACYGIAAYWIWGFPPEGIKDWLAALPVFTLAPISVPVIELLKEYKKGL